MKRSLLLAIAFLMLMVAMQYGLSEITDKNIEQVVANLLEHAAQEGEK